MSINKSERSQQESRLAEVTKIVGIILLGSMMVVASVSLFLTMAQSYMSALEAEEAREVPVFSLSDYETIHDDYMNHTQGVHGEDKPNEILQESTEKHYAIHE